LILECNGVDGGEEEIFDNLDKTALFLSYTPLPPGELESKRLGVTDLLFEVDMFGREKVVNDLGDGTGDSFGIAFLFSSALLSSSLSSSLSLSSSDTVIASRNS
jgi:hypothetical protein